MGITPKQNRLLRAGIKALALQEDYRNILDAQAGVRSSKDLTQDGFSAVMEYLGGLGFEYRRAQPAPVRPLNSGAGSGPGSAERGAESRYLEYLKKWKKLGYRAGMATAEQLTMIETLWDRLEAYWNKDGRGHRDAALRGFLVARFCTEGLRFLSFTKAGQMIEALKAIDVRCYRKSRIKQ